MPKTQYLLRRGGRYYIRLRVPKDLLGAYTPTTEICRALGSGDFREAKRALTTAKLKIETEFERRRIELSYRKDEADRLSQLDLHTVTLLVLDWFEDQKKDNHQRATIDILIDVEDSPEDNGDNEKRAKTENSIRYVPVHPILQKIGFLEFVEERRKSGHVRLFHELKKDQHGGYSGDFSKWFGRFLNTRIDKTRKTVFHSFRHCYRDALREANINRAAELQLGGWSSGTTDEIYGKGAKPATLYEAVKKTDYPGLDLSHLISASTPK